MSDSNRPDCPDDLTLFTMEFQRFLRNSSLKYNLSFNEVIGTMFMNAVVVAIQGAAQEAEEAGED